MTGDRDRETGTDLPPCPLNPCPFMRGVVGSAAASQIVLAREEGLALPLLLPLILGFVDEATAA